MEKSTEKDYKFAPITPQQIRSMGVAALADRPNAAGQYGQSGLSPAQLKSWFDKLVTLAAEKINELQGAITGEDAARYIGLALGEYKTLDELITAMGDGRFADTVMKVYPNAAVDVAVSLQSVIYGIAEEISNLGEDKLDKKTPGVLSAYTVGADDENGTVEISGAPKPFTIPLYDAKGELLVGLPTREGSALNLGYFVNYMNQMAEHIGAGVNFTMDPETFIVTIEVLNRAGTVIYRTYLDLPLEEAIVGGSYDEENRQIVFKLRSGEQFSVKIEDLVNGLVTEAKHNADMKAIDDKINLLFGEYVEEINELVGGDYVDYS